MGMGAMLGLVGVAPESWSESTVSYNVRHHAAGSCKMWRLIYFCQGLSRDGGRRPVGHPLLAFVWHAHACWFRAPISLPRVSLTFILSVSPPVFTAKPGTETGTESNRVGLEHKAVAVRIPTQSLCTRCAGGRIWRAGPRVP